MAAAATKSVVAQLREPFPLDKIYARQGPGGKTLDYVSIETVLERLISVAPDYSIVGKVESLVFGRFSPNKNDEGDFTPLTPTAVVSVQLSIGDKTAFGIGEMSNASVDMAVKSATSEAIKNAAKNGFGVALDLWNADYRDAVGAARKRASMTEAQLKSAVFAIARTKLDKEKPSAAEIGKLFDVAPGKLTDEATLRAILDAEDAAA